jgi:hypothetical protein
MTFALNHLSYFMMANLLIPSLQVARRARIAFVCKPLTLFADSPERGAETSVYLASSPDVESVSGKYYAKSKVRPSSRASRNPLTAKRLWDLSAELTGLEGIALPARA